MMESSNEYQSNKISFDAIKIGLASPEKIREWSRGECVNNLIRQSVKVSPVIQVIAACTPFDAIQQTFYQYIVPSHRYTLIPVVKIIVVERKPHG